ncbi:MAG: DNA adenine methylase [Acidobacteriota bacterium]|nr:DNA adenine methylase [Acidobacteriota bacterium]
MTYAAHQQCLFETPLHHVINIAAVRQLSPFRYPGGKTWLTPRIRQWLKHPPAEFIEPFAGGGIVSLTVAAENLAKHVTMVELDEQVAAVWQTIFADNQAEWLAERIVAFDLSLESLREELARAPQTRREIAFQAILKNRTFHGGILAAGSAPLKQGENGKGIKSRWYADTLKKRILAIAQLRDRITVVHGDAFDTIRQFATNSNAAFFIDPPYSASGKGAGKRLYTHHKLDHQELFQLLANVAGDILMTYDNAPQILEFAEANGFEVKTVAMKNNHHAEMTELLIGRSLSWLDACV